MPTGSWVNASDPTPFARTTRSSSFSNRSPIALDLGLILCTEQTWIELFTGLYGGSFGRQREHV